MQGNSPRYRLEGSACSSYNILQTLTILGLGKFVAKHVPVHNTVGPRTRGSAVRWKEIDMEVGTSPCIRFKGPVHPHIPGRDSEVNNTVRLQTRPSKCGLSITKNLKTQPRDNIGIYGTPSLGSPGNKAKMEGHTRSQPCKFVRVD